MALPKYVIYGGIGLVVVLVIVLIVYFATRKKSTSSPSSVTPSPSLGTSTDPSESPSVLSEVPVTQIPEKFLDSSKYYAIQNQNTKDVLDYTDKVKPYWATYPDTKYYLNQGFYYEPKSGSLASCHTSGVALVYDQSSDTFTFKDITKIDKQTVLLLDIGNDLFSIVSADRKRVLSNPGDGKLVTGAFVPDKISEAEKFAAVDISPGIIEGMNAKSCYKF